MKFKPKKTCTQKERARQRYSKLFSPKATYGIGNTKSGELLKANIATVS